jgi:branched-chain amino acid transport system substrate-binding protein
MASMALGLVGMTAACGSSSTSTATTTAGSGGSGTTGGTTITPADSTTKTSCPSSSSCFVSGAVVTVSGPVPGLFKGSIVGADAYLAYQNSLGGLDGRKFKLLTADDGFDCSQNRSLTEAMLPKVFAFTGNFSLQDNCGGVIIAQHPEVPDVSIGVAPSVLRLPNVFSVSPATGFSEGPFDFFKKMDPEAVEHVGTLVAGVSTSEIQGALAQGAMTRAGWKVVYKRTTNPLETDFTSDVLAMQQKGVQTVFLFAEDETGISRFLQEAHTQGFQPKLVVLGPPAYTNTFVSDAGGASVVNGAYLTQPASLYLGGDASSVPAVGTFLRWVHGVYPGFNPDLFTMYGWTSAELYVNALKAAGAHPTQSSLLTALKNVKNFNAGGIVPDVTPVTKKPVECYLLGRIENGEFKRYHMPATGFRCDGKVYQPSLGS